MGRFAQQSAAGTDYFLADALGSVRQITDSSGFPSMYQSFDPFGNLLSRTGAASSSFGFAGEWTDATGLQYLRARYYSTAQGRFMSRDPFPGLQGMPGTLHPYAYALNNPILNTDPSGEIAPFLVAAIVGGVIGGGINLGAQLLTTRPQTLNGFFYCIDWAQVGIAFGSGAVAGLIGWMVPSLLPAAASIWSSIGIGALTGSLASGGGQIAANLLSHNNWNNGLLGTMALGGLTGGIAGGLGFGIRQKWTTQNNNTNTALVPYDTEFAARQLLTSDSRISISRMQAMIPDDVPNTFIPSSTIQQGYKYQFNINGAPIELKWHSPDLNAFNLYGPSSNSGTQWTAQIKVNKFFLGSDWSFYKVQQRNRPVRVVRNLSNWEKEDDDLLPQATSPTRLT